MKKIVNGKQDSMNVQNKNFFFGALILVYGLASLYGAAQETQHDLYCVVLAGGTGERLWPLSRKNKPKQFLSLDGEKTLLEATFHRLNNVKGTKHNWVVTTQELAPLVKATMKGRLEHIVVEPVPRNTGPAILLTLMEIQRKNPNAYVIFLPADHYIPDSDAFANALNNAYKHQTNAITLLGVKPLFAATGYGYIQIESTHVSSHQPIPVLGFFEKPSRDKAEKYLADGNMLWNAGIFCGKVKSFINEYKTHAQPLYKAMKQYRKRKTKYDSLPSISIDYAVLEKSRNITVLPVSFEWSDIGNLAVYLSIRKNSSPKNTIINIESKNTLYHGKKQVVALIDVPDLCIVETDEVLLITSQKNAEHVKKAVEHVKKDEKLSSLV